MIAAALAAFALAATPSIEIDSYLYQADRVCFSPLDGNTNTLIAVVDTFEVVTWETLNYGTTSMSVQPCIPTDCPDPYTLISGNVCSVSDPFVGTVAATSPVPSATGQAATVPAPLGYLVRAAVEYGHHG